MALAREAGEVTAEGRRSGSVERLKVSGECEFGQAGLAAAQSSLPRTATSPVATFTFHSCHTPPGARLKLPMGKQPATGARLGAEVETMLRDLFLDGLTRMLGRKYPDAPEAMCEDAVYEAVAKLLKAGEDREITNPRGYLTTIAINEVRRGLSRAAREVLPDDEGEDDGSEWFGANTSLGERPTEVRAIGGAVFTYVKGMVEQWESQKLRATALLVLEGAYMGELLTGAELAERLSDILGEDVAEDTARQWRKRALDRLRAQLAAEGFPIEE